MLQQSSSKLPAEEVDHRHNTEEKRTLKLPDLKYECACTNNYDGSEAARQQFRNCVTNSVQASQEKSKDQSKQMLVIQKLDRRQVSPSNNIDQAIRELKQQHQQKEQLQIRNGGVFAVAGQINAAET